MRLLLLLVMVMMLMGVMLSCSPRDSIHRARPGAPVQPGIPGVHPAAVAPRAVTGRRGARVEGGGGDREALVLLLVQRVVVQVVVVVVVQVVG